MVKKVNRIVGFKTKKEAIEHRKRWHNKQRVSYGYSPKYKHFYEWWGGK